jgi:mannose-6-phosphate isomerase-like protein (cupin superfamily)
VLLDRSGVVVANLRFGAHASIDEHAAPFEVDVVCVEGEGFVSVGAAISPLRAGECVAWPSGTKYCLWTKGSAMETLMVEHHT